MSGETTILIGDTVKSFIDSTVLSSKGDVVLDQVTVRGSGSGIQAAPNVWTTVRSWFNPTAYRNRQKASRTLLHGFSGTIQKGEMLLVIGKPGSGCTTFLKTLAGMHGEYKETTGTITYGGRIPNNYDQNLVKFTFCAEEDEHLPTLTVAETLRFAIRSSREPRTSKKTIEDAVETLAELVGLNHVLNTRVGSVRGLSGGERRRVTLAETMATCPDILCFDNPTSGLDSSTALEFLEMMREFTTQRGSVTAMSLYQGSNAIVPLFEKILVINSGRQVYYGAASKAKSYFEGLGFVCPERTTTTDFLNSMSAGPEARTIREGFELQAPKSAEDFERVFHQHEYFRAIKSVVHKKNQKSQVRPKANIYSLPFPQQVFECAYRQYRVLVTDWHTWAIEALCIVVQSLILGTLFRNQSRESKSFFTLASSLFYSVLVPALQSMSEFGSTFAQRALVMRQKRYRFYRPMSYALGLVATDAVWKIIVILYNVPLYWLTGFQRTPGHFCIWFLTVYVEHMALSMIFRAIAAFSPSAGRAVLPVGIMFNLFVIYTGLYIPGPQMQIWLFWIKYCSPLYYAFETVMVNEFASIDYFCSSVDLAPNGPGYSSIANQVCAVKGSISGQPMVSGISYLQAQYGFKASHLWRNIGINAVFFLFFAIVTGIGMELHKLPAGKLATVFYKAEPKYLVPENDSSASDSEKGRQSETTPPITVESRRSVLCSRQFWDHNKQTLAWKDITLNLNVGGQEKRLLDNLNGFIEAGQLTALMGVSGAGKTTLLNTLAGRLTIGNLSGELLLGGKPLPKSFRRYMGYVQQQDIHLPTQTVREALQVIASLRRPETVSTGEKNSYVEAVIEMLEMEDIADALIGIPGAGLNLEQRKRVTIGVELAAKPDILFLDEPSSGLDGQSALTIIRLLRKLADSGQTILCTIHQPAAEIMEIFDHLILMVRGEVNLLTTVRLALAYFGKISRRCREDENPAEYFLEIVGAGSRSMSTSDWAQLWNQSKMCQERKLQLSSLTALSSEVAISTRHERTYAVPYLTQLNTILHRTWLFYWRSPTYFVSKLFLIIASSLSNSLSFLQSPSTENGTYNRVFSVFMAMIVGPPLGLQTAPQFITLREIFIQREQTSLTYHWSIFVLSTIVVELPYAVFTAIIYWFLWYYPVGYSTSSTAAGYSFLMYTLFITFATSLSQLCASVLPSLSSTLTANGFFFMFYNTFAGTLSPRPLTPKGWSWYYYVSPLFYLSEGMIASELKGLKIQCTEEETSIFYPPNGMSCFSYAKDFLQTATGYLTNPGNTDSCRYCGYKDGEAYYAQYGYDFSQRYKNIGIFIGFIAFNYTFIFVFTYLTKIRKWEKQ